ncbi:hypothetical protein [Bacillus cereus group sp. MYBK217-2]|uniref:hypothetical protein n=1 Tax=Bacillus cereus group sp. MYBK217-2 TaxID=3450661 RepID=UPI003F797762
MTFKMNGCIVRLDTDFRNEEKTDDGKICIRMSFTYGDTLEEAITYLLRDTSLQKADTNRFQYTQYSNVCGGLKPGILEESKTPTNRKHCLLSNVPIKELKDKLIINYVQTVGWWRNYLQTKGIEV